MATQRTLEPLFETGTLPIADVYGIVLPEFGWSYGAFYTPRVEDVPTSTGLVGGDLSFDASVLIGKFLRLSPWPRDGRHGQGRGWD